jgi:L-asparagine transporter-like permease
LQVTSEYLNQIHATQKILFVFCVLFFLSKNDAQRCFTAILNSAAILNSVAILNFYTWQHNFLFLFHLKIFKKMWKYCLLLLSKTTCSQIFHKTNYKINHLQTKIMMINIISSAFLLLSDVDLFCFFLIKKWNPPKQVEHI